MKLTFPNGEHGQVMLSDGVNRIGSAPDQREFDAFRAARSALHHHARNRIGRAGVAAIEPEYGRGEGQRAVVIKQAAHLHAAPGGLLQHSDHCLGARAGLDQIQLQIDLALLLGQQLGQLHLRPPNRQPVAAHARSVQHVVNQPHHVRHLPLHDAVRVLDCDIVAFR